MEIRQKGITEILAKRFGEYESRIRDLVNAFAHWTVQITRDNQLHQLPLGPRAWPPRLIRFSRSLAGLRSYSPALLCVLFDVK